MKKNIYFFFKRVFDIVASLLGIIITSPIWLIAIIGIIISDPGPVFFKAVRIGKDNKEFSMWKFRSMRVPKKDSEKSEASFRADTNRIFPFGALIRRLKIDELPQLINILAGKMSVVGPRPAAKDQVKIVRAGRYNIASTVRPGLTGTAALYDYIYGDTVEDSDEYEKLVLPTRLELEVCYVERMGIFYDIKLIWYTVVCVLFSIFKKQPKRIFADLTSNVKLDTGSESQEVEV